MTDKKVSDSWPLSLRIWFWVQLLVVSFDASFVLSRPYSFPEGPLGAFYPAFHKYMQVDRVYSDYTNPFGWTVSTLCLIENAILAYAMFVLHPREQSKSTKHDVMQWSDYIALFAVIMQFGKSLFYWFNDAYGGFSHVIHNDWFDLTCYFIIPNVIWLIAPVVIFRFFQKKINSTLALCEGKAKAN